MDVRVRISFDRTSTGNHSASTAIEILDTLGGIADIEQMTDEVKQSASALADWAASEARRRTQAEKLPNDGGKDSASP
jgi:hypothetical protein